MREIRIGFQSRPQHGLYPEMRAAWVAAEEMGVDAIYNWDHFYPLYDDPDGLHFECWSLIAAMAEATSRVEIGALVTCMSYRNPNLLGDIARTVDHISGGRLVLGLGSGWFEKDYEQFGYEFGTTITRLHAFRDALPVVRNRMEVGNPPPVRGRIPIMIGGGGEKVMLRLVAEYADIWHGFGEPEVIRHKCEVLDRHCADIGRDAAEIERSIMLNEDEIPHDPAELDARLQEFLDAGATFFIFGASGPDWPLDGLGRLLAWREARS